MEDPDIVLLVDGDAGAFAEIGAGRELDPVGDQFDGEGGLGGLADTLSML
jgi:hypothetical protein